MSKDIRIKKGLDIKLKGKAEEVIASVSRSSVYTINPSDFHGLIPKMLIKEGDQIKAGSPIFYSKTDESVKVVSPVSGTVKEILRGERRVILSIKIVADQEDSYLQHEIKNPGQMDGDAIKNHLLESGCWSFIKQRPYDVMAKSTDTPKSIFVSTYATAPLEADTEFALADKLNYFQAGITALSKLTSGKLHLGIKGKGKSIFKDIQDTKIHQVYGPHPAGNVGVHISKIDPINAGERVWIVGANDVAIIGELFLTGKFNATRTLALAGSEVKEPKYYTIKIGAEVASLVNNKIATDNVRYISGNVFTGKRVSLDGFLGYYDNTFTVIPEGNTFRLFGWMPFASPQVHSFSRTALSWLTPGKKYALNTNLNGEERALVVTGEMEEVMPINIFPMQLLKSCLIKDIDGMEALGIYEVAPEDFALVDYINTSKLEAQELIREALDLMIKEVG